jgi:hypothetical protein
MALFHLAVEYRMNQCLPKEMLKGREKTMKMTAKTTIGLSAIITALASGCQVSWTPGGVVATASVPAPVVVEAPPTYVWDGVEFVGDYNGQYMCLNGAGVWVACDPVVLARFHGWEGGHPDWRRTAMRYDPAHRPDARAMRRVQRREEER